MMAMTETAPKKAARTHRQAQNDILQDRCITAVRELSVTHPKIKQGMIDAHLCAGAIIGPSTTLKIVNHALQACRKTGWLAWTRAAGWQHVLEAS